MSEIKNKILIIDDEIAVLSILEFILKKSNFQVTSCANINQALDLLKTNKYDCILTDALMPIMSGFDFIKLLKKDPRHTSTPILMLTKKNAPDDIKRAMQAGASDYILKPIDENILLDKIELCLNQLSKKRYVFEIELKDELEKVEVTQEWTVLKISESGIVLKSPTDFSPQTSFKLSSSLFDKLELKKKHFQFLHSEKKDSYYELRFSFLGLSDSELKKIRTWIQKESLKWRK